MTEDEAKTKWCPHARTLEWQVGVARGADPQLIAASVNREPGDYDKEGNETVVVQGRHRCIASTCMAWRWNDPWTSQTEEGVGGDLVLRLKRKAGEPRLGYCGLAGSPS